MNIQTHSFNQNSYANAMALLNVESIHSKRENAIQNNTVWDLSSDGCSMSDDKISGNILFLLQRKTQNFVRFYLRVEDINDTKLNNLINNKINDPSSLLQMLRLAKLGVRELANEAEAFDYKNIFEYVNDNGMDEFNFLSAQEISEVVTMNNLNFMKLIQKQKEMPPQYYAFIKYSLKIMLQRHIENNGDCGMA